jgi:hypothetical protein
MYAAISADRYLGDIFKRLNPSFSLDHHKAKFNIIKNPEMSQTVYAQQKGFCLSDTFPSLKHVYRHSTGIPRRPMAKYEFTDPSH